MKVEQFIEALQKQNILLSSHQIKQFSLYYDTLVDWNQKMNLTALVQKEEVYLKHFYDSLTIAFHFPFTNQAIIDIGAGAGFPSIPLKIIYPDLQITIIDALQKRTVFLEHLVSLLQLKDCEIKHARAEDYILEKREYYDIAMARAVAKLSILDELCLPFVKLNGHFLALKGKKAKEEIEEANKGIRILGGKIIEQEPFLLTDDSNRMNIVIQKVKQTPKIYPRTFGQIKKKPL